MLCALFCHPNYQKKLFKNHWDKKYSSYRLTEKIAIPCINYSLALPTKKEKAQNTLYKAIHDANQEGCRLFALPNLSGCLLEKNDYFISGQDLSLALLPPILDQEKEDWRYRNLAIPISDPLMIKTALYLAQEVKNIHLFAGDKGLRQKIADQIYWQNGMVCHQSQLPPLDMPIICPPQINSNHPQPPTFWQYWPLNIHIFNHSAINICWGEALLLSTLNKENYQKYLGLDLYQKLDYLRKSAQQYQLSPIIENSAH